MTDRILVIEDDALIQDFLVDGLSNEGFQVVRADGISKALQLIQHSSLNAILSDYELRDGTAFDLLKWLKARDIRIPVIVLTGHASIDLAVQAVKNGAEQFIPKPVDFAYLTTMLHRTLANFRSQERDVATNLERARYARDPFLGHSAAIQELSRSAKRASEANTTVL